jgi:hypothetical protein
MFEELEENQPKKQEPTDWRGTIIGLCMLPMFALFMHFGREDLALPSVTYLGMTALAVALRWNLRKHVWFWMVIGLVLALHVVLLLKVPWPKFTVNRITLLPFGVADLLLVLGIIQFVKTIIVRDMSDDDEQAN